MKLLQILILATSAQAQNMALHMDLSGPWKIQAGEDRSEFALPGFDDRGWRQLAVPVRGPAPVGYWWMRRTVEVPMEADLGDLVLTIGGLNEVFEVFVNGERVAAAGTPGSFATSPIARARSFPIPAVKQRRITFALRLWRTRWSSLPARERRDEGPWLLTGHRNAPALPGLLPREKMAVPGAIMAGFLAVFAMLLVAGWSTQRRRTDLLLLASFLASEAFRRGYEYVSVVWDWPHAAHAIGALSVSTSWVFLTWYAARVLGGWARIPLPLAGIKLGLHAATNWAFLLSRPLDFLRISDLRWTLADIAVACFLVEGALAFRGGDKAKAGMAVALALLGVLGGGLLVGSGGLIFPATALLLSLVLTVHLIRSLGSAQQRLDQEMQAARMIQQLLIPESAITGVEGVYLPAQEVGGDFWQALPCADGGLLIVIGDVSGKGLRAAMVVALVLGVVRSRREHDPAALLAQINAALLEAPPGGFVTCCIAKQSADGSWNVANAGHCAPYRNGVEIELADGLPLSLSPEAEWRNLALPSGPLTLVTDGVVEAENAQRELFGFDRTRGISGGSARKIAEAAKAWGQNDDITVVTVRGAA